MTRVLITGIDFRIKVSCSFEFTSLESVVMSLANKFKLYLQGGGLVPQCKWE